MNLFIELRRHGKLAAKRHPMYEKNRFGKLWMCLTAIFGGGYLVFFGVMLATALDGGAREPYHLMNMGLIFVLFLDFLMRFPFQTTPTQEVKPYLLLPVRRNRLIDFLLLRSGLHGYNLFWLLFFGPFALLTVVRFYGFTGMLTYCIGIWLLMLFNNYWFLLCRTLMSERIWWILLPVGVYGGIAAALFIPDDSPLFIWSMELGEGFITGNLLSFIGVLLAVGVLILINRVIMSRLIYVELNKVEDTKVKHLSEYKFLDRYGEIGEYMRLELKLLLRNRICKASLRSVIVLVVAFSCLLSFTDVYDGTGMKNFIMIYNFVIFGILFLSSLMSYEGNYMDGLMSRKESIYTLLRAKYILYSVAILVPLLLMIPAMATGKLSVLSCIAWAIFVVGCVYCFLFQLAVFNTKTVDLNAKMTNRQNMGTGLQNLITFAAFGVPLLLNTVLTALWGDVVTAWILMGIGIAFIVTSRFWLMNVYRRFMKRRYKNMEGFRNSRQK